MGTRATVVVRRYVAALCFLLLASAVFAADDPGQKSRLKTSPSALYELGRGKTWADLNVIFHRDVPFSDAREAVIRAGARIEHPFATRYSPSRRIRIRLSPDSLEALAADERVLAITGLQNFPMEEHNVVSAALSHVPELHEAPFALSGRDVVVSSSELSRADRSHPEFGSRLVLNTVPEEDAYATHPTHVAGTIGASGVRAESKGMAPAVSILQFCATCGFDNGVWLELKDTELQKAGVVADNNSWGFVLGWRTQDGLPVFLFRDQYYGAYDLVLAAPLDEISIERGVLFVLSAGNDGNPPSNLNGAEWSRHLHADGSGEAISGQFFCYSANGSGSDCPATCTSCEIVRHHSNPPYPFDTMSVTASGKNVVAVGAVINGSEIAPFSSRGPAKDGRVKPDLVARGVGVLSSTPGNQYGQLSGTSMAAPVVTGIAALLAEQWRKTFGGANPRPEELKALLIFGSADLGNPGPDYTYGFGLVNARSSAEAILADRGEGRRIRSLNVAQERTHEFTVSLAEPQNLRLVLNWADPAIPYFPSNPAVADKALVNDLDLTVVDAGGHVFRPFVLDKANPTANATTGINSVDNVEMVEIANAAVGTYRVRVSGANVIEGPQTAILVSGADLVWSCADATEGNDTPAAAYNVDPGREVRASVCSRDDVDHFRLVATDARLRVTIVTGDTPLRATLTGTGISRVQELAANKTSVLEHDVTALPNAMLLKIEATAAIGTAPQYRLWFGEPQQQNRRRSARH
jgi:hypothetical protein